MWNNKFNFDELGLTKSVILAFIILFFHIGILLLVALLAVFFGFITKYFAWILLGLGLVIAGTIYYILYSLKKNQKGIAEILSMPEFKGKTVEVRILGGLASLKVDDSRASAHLLEYEGGPETRYLESPDSSRVRELSELARLLENKMITPEEYQQAKNKIFNG